MKIYLHMHTHTNMYTHILAYTHTHMQSCTQAQTNIHTIFTLKLTKKTRTHTHMLIQHYNFT